MPRTAARPSVSSARTPGRPPRDRVRRRLLALALAASAAGALPVGALAQSSANGGAPAAAASAASGPELTHLDVVRNDDGAMVSFAVSFELPKGVEEALHKGVPLYFVAEAEVLRDRWYWRDKRVARVERSWRLAFQPLSRKYRVSFGGLNQNFDTLADALAALRRVANWRVADAAALDGNGHYLEFAYRLDTSLMPRPLQIGLGGQAEWTLRLERTQRID